ncbi:SprT family zinc-dependent metalloprotease [Formosa sp. PL04]|uniref:M48 family metallopeptidase n=1 Tax=Formosa sp. PL04 TaxID=3081755 RepID=UPI0029821EA4|nr:SprT family zinc-dependent metalloprotease [Formosa sp. PL04]MDW5289151.1 SprT family zinc-dependent metalloprotease [Formosa sp. PL04]
MERSLKYGPEEIVYTLYFRERKTLGITVNPDRTTEVNAPIGSSIKKIEEKIHKRAAWILKQQDHFLSFEPRETARKFVSGESHLYLGRQYQLQLITSNEEKVKHIGGKIEVRTINSSKAEKLLEAWYLEKAETWFHNIAEPLINHFKKYRVEPNKLEIRKMQNRWGSCSTKGRILLNPELIKAPKACIEYVITHELCHLVHRDHTNAFFELQQKEFPEWKKWKNKLEVLLA